MGIHGIKPPTAARSGFEMVGVAPPFIQYAMDRPAENSISVAIIG